MSHKQTDVVNSFISLTEKMANSKNQVLDFGSPEMTFYRGEIHMIKMIGDMPGIYCSELARHLGITRAVVHRTINILHKRGLVIKEKDDNNKKKFYLFLSDTGKEAYQLHADYHQKHDKELFDYLDGLTTSQLDTVFDFLQHATNLIDNQK